MWKTRSTEIIELKVKPEEGDGGRRIDYWCAVIALVAADEMTIYNRDAVMIVSAIFFLLYP